MKDDDAKKAILARRARFIAAAMMGAGAMSCDRKDGEPAPCLTLTTPAPDPTPTVCLSFLPLPSAPDAGATADDAGTTDTGATDAGPRKDAGVPRPCLAQSPPRPCLKPAPPKACLDFY